MSDLVIKSQQDAINARGSLLVSASAGSGKTHVLVERVIKTVINEVNKTPADKLLIVTFTEAAANELKSRISARLTAAVSQEPDNQYYIQQKNLFALSTVSTIDAFCYKLVKDHFQELGLPDDLKIANKSDCATAKKDAFTNALNRRFSEDKDNFTRFLKSCYASGKSSVEAAQLLVDKLYEYSSTLSRPDIFLSKTAFNLYDQSDLADSALKLYYDNVTHEFDAVVALIQKAKEDCDKYAELVEFSNVLNNVLTFCDGLKESLSSNDFAQIELYLQKNIEYQISEEEIDKLHGKRINPLKAFNRAVGGFSAFLERLKEISSCGGKSVDKKLKTEKEFISYLCDLTNEYGENYKNTLISKNMLDFNLIERCAVKLLYDFVKEEKSVSPYGKDIAGAYKAVLVDEFQDISALQYDLFYAVSDCGKNLFAVGDIKQSIYRFRGSDPSLFEGLVDSYKVYDKDDLDHPSKIFLNCNFRSRPEICDFANGFFNSFMTKEYGGTDYNENQYLIPNGTFCENLSKPNVEIVYTVLAKKNQIKYEALFAANKIKEIIASNMRITDKESKQPRPVKYSDITVIARSNKTLEQYKEIFEKAGLPVSYSNEDMLTSSEIKLLVSYLKIILNPHDSISLLSVLLSPLYAFSANESLTIQAVKSKRKSLFSKLVLLSGKNEKLSGFVKDYREIKDFSAVNSVGDTVLYIIDKYSLRDTVATFDNGAVRRENLLNFERIAYDFSNENENLYSFVSYLENQRETDTQAVSSIGDNTVKLITMHSSKGLQFPVCIVAGCSKELFKNNGDKIENRFVMNSKSGLGVKIRNYESNVLYKSVAFNKISAENKADDLSEEMRLFYVAVTRACEKLIFMSSTRYDLNNHFATALKNNKPQKAVYDVSFIKSFSDLLNIYALHNSDSHEIKALYPAECEPLTINKVHVSVDNAQEMELPRGTKKDFSSFAVDDKLVKVVGERLKYEYPYKDVNTIAAKSSVSALSKQNHDDYDFTSRPVFAQKGKLSSSQKGTALHKFMQYANFDAATKDLQKEIERIYEYGWLSLDEKNSLEVDKIEVFLGGRLLKRITSSPVVLREKKFLIEVPAGELDRSLVPPVCEETVVIQGAIDCLFEEDGEIVIVDFKTDRTNDPELLRERYAEQLRYYQLACEKLLNKKVKSKIIYSVFTGKEIEL